MTTTKTDECCVRCQLFDAVETPATTTRTIPMFAVIAPHLGTDALPVCAECADQVDGK